MARNQTQPLVLEAKDVAIQTATVFLKTVQVNNRQMTQSVFKQLEERELINEATIELRGTVWGWVNFQAPGMAIGRQFLVQIGEKLFRCPVDMYTFQQMKDIVQGYERRDYMPEPLRRYFNSTVHWLTCYFVATAMETTKSPDCYRINFDPYGDIEINKNKLINSSLYLSYVMSKVWLYENECKEFLRTMIKSKTVLSSHEYWDLACQHDDDAADYITRWDAMITRLATIEQVFIAC